MRFYTTKVEKILPRFKKYSHFINEKLMIQYFMKR